MRQDLKALKSFTYAGRALKVGDQFSAPSNDARALRAVRRAEPADTYQTTEAQAAVIKDGASAPAKKTSGTTAAKKAATGKKAKASGQ